MIINGGSRSNGGFFASHLMRIDHNERVEVRDIRGLLAENVPEALREMQTIACGTMCKNWFYHADINTREDEHLRPEQWTAAADALERELNLEGQPRFIVEHEKDGRTHQHIIWSRIDLDSMTAVSDSHNYRRHETVARALEKAFDHQPTPGNPQPGIRHRAAGAWPERLGELSRRAERYRPEGGQGRTDRAMAARRQRPGFRRRRRGTGLHPRPGRPARLRDRRSRRG